MNRIFIVVGVSGSGKTTIAKLLSKQINKPFLDADDYHPKGNVVKMSNGIPLTDEDREPWLYILNQKLKEESRKEGVILACSALKESYRKIIAKEIDVVWVYLDGDFDVIKSRMENRRGHFMKTTLLQSQFDCLEVPTYGIKVDVKQEPNKIVNDIIKNTI